jgi:tetratricopeptide (TPR) repeat protein
VPSSATSIATRKTSTRRSRTTTRRSRSIPSFDPAFINRGELYALRGEHDRAIADFTRAIKLGSRQVVLQVLINRGIAYERKGDLDRAIADHSRAIKEATRLLRFVKRATADVGIAASAHQARGDAYAKKGDKSAAEADYEAARKFSERQKTMY